MAKSDLKRTLMDIRKMRRAVRVRSETNPEVVAETLETILKESIALSTTGDGTLSRSAIKEIRQVRKGLIAQQIDAGKDTSKFIGSFSAVIDTIDQTAGSVGADVESERKDQRSSMLESLPSSDTVISAIMTANPLFGYTLKMGKDLANTAKRSMSLKRDRDKEEAMLRKRRLEEQGLVLEEQMDNAKSESQSTDTPTNESTLDLQHQMLKEIKDEIHELVLIWGDDKLEQVDKSTKETNEHLERIYSEDVKQNTLERNSEKFDSLNSVESEYEGGGAGLGSILGDGKDSGKKGGGGLLGSLLGGFTIGRLLLIVAPITSMFGVLLKIGKKFGKLLGRGSGILAAAYAIYDFFDGFINAGDFFDKDDSKISFMDRVKAGFASVLSGVLEPINWITDTFFGVDLMGGKDRDEFTKTYVWFFDNFIENIVGMAKWIGGMIVDKFKEWASAGTTKLTEMVKGAFDPLTELMQNIKNYIKDSVGGFAVGFKNWIFGGDDDNEPMPNKEKNDRVGSFSGYTSDKPEKSSRSNFVQLEQDSSATRAMKKSEIIAEEKAKLSGNNQNGSSNIIAPTNNTTNVSNSQYMGSSFSNNRESTHRMNSITNMFGGAVAL